MSESQFAATIPQPQIPFLGADGKVARPWLYFFLSLLGRTGGIPGIPASDLQAQIDSLFAELAMADVEPPQSATDFLAGELFSEVSPEPSGAMFLAVDLFSDASEADTFGQQLLAADLMSELAASGPVNDGSVPISSASITTTDATPTLLTTISIALNTTAVLDITVVARRTGGVSGTTGDSAGYIVSTIVKNIAGTTSIVAQTLLSIGEDQAAWDAVVSASGANILVTVTGAAGNTVNWIFYGSSRGVS